MQDIKGSIKVSPQSIRVGQEATFTIEISNGENSTYHKGDIFYTVSFPSAGFEFVSSDGAALFATEYLADEKVLVIENDVQLEPGVSETIQVKVLATSAHSANVDLNVEVRNGAGNATIEDDYGTCLLKVTAAVDINKLANAAAKKAKTTSVKFKDGFKAGYAAKG